MNALHDTRATRPLSDRVSIAKALLRRIDRIARVFHATPSENTARRCIYRVSALKREMAEVFE